MRVRFKKADLLPAAAAVQSVANPQSTLPILSNVLITTEHDNIVSLTATDFETRVKIEVPAEVEKKGVATVPAKTFYDLVKELPEDGEVQLEAREKGAIIKCRDIRAELATMPARDFPRWPEMGETTNTDLPQKDMKKLLEKILFAIPVRDPRKVLLGAHFEFKMGTLSAVATDGKILAYMNIAVENPPADRALIIPHKILEELSRNLGDEGVVTISFDERQIAFQLNNALYLSNQIEGKYPAYEAVVPKEFTREFRFQKPPMVSAIRRASILTDIKNSAISLGFVSDTVNVEAESYDKGRIHEEIPAVNDGADFKIVFNYKFVSEVLKSFEREEVVLQANTPTTPAVFRNADTPENFYLIMPIKLTELKDEYDSEETPDEESRAQHVPDDEE